jgi:hypothetical protein
MYLVPAAYGQITRYDTTLPFGTAASYAIFDTAANVNSNSIGFAGGVFDGRYVYLVPFDNGSFFGQITRYDTTVPFTAASGYTIFNTTTGNTNSCGFDGGVFDGRFIYLVPSFNGAASGQITRIDAYPGPKAVALNALSAANGLTFTGTTTATGSLVLSTTTAGTAASGTSALPAQVAGYLSIVVNGSTQKIPYYNL